MGKRVSKSAYEVQRIELTRSAACEAVVEAFNGVKDWKGACVTTLVDEILRKLGFE